MTKTDARAKNLRKDNQARRYHGEKKERGSTLEEGPHRILKTRKKCRPSETEDQKEKKERPGGKKEKRVGGAERTGPRYEDQMAGGATSEDAERKRERPLEMGCQGHRL